MREGKEQAEDAQRRSGRGREGRGRGREGPGWGAGTVLEAPGWGTIQGVGGAFPSPAAKLPYGPGWPRPREPAFWPPLWNPFSRATTQARGWEEAAGLPGAPLYAWFPPCGLGKIQARPGPGMPSVSWEGQGNGEAGPGPFPPSIPTPVASPGFHTCHLPPAGPDPGGYRTEVFTSPSARQPPRPVDLISRISLHPGELLGLPSQSRCPHPCLCDLFSSSKSWPSFQNVNLGMFPRDFKLSV